MAVHKTSTFGELNLISMKKSALDPIEFNEYYGLYIHKLADDTDLIEAYETGKQKVIDFFKGIPESKLNYRYETEKWSVKEVLQHLIDTERIFMYRCLRVARNDKTALAGFDQNIYIEPSGAANKTIDALLNEFEINRTNSIELLKSLSEEHLKYIGSASGFDLSARAAAFIIPGHDIWHMEIVKERYL